MRRKTFAATLLTGALVLGSAAIAVAQTAGSGSGSGAGSGSGSGAGSGAGSAAGSGSGAGSPPAVTQGTQSIKRTIIQRVDVPGTNLETIVALVDVAANFAAGRHTHPGDVIGYVMEGEFSMTFDGQAEKVLKAGESVTVPSGTIHNEGTKDKPAKLIAVYVLEKGKPLAAPVK